MKKPTAPKKKKITIDYKDSFKKYKSISFLLMVFLGNKMHYAVTVQVHKSRLFCRVTDVVTNHYLKANPFTQSALTLIYHTA